MEQHDVSTITIIRGTGQSYLKAIEEEWLVYLGFTEEEIDSNQIQIVVQADHSKKHNQPFIGIAKKK